MKHVAAILPFLLLALTAALPAAEVDLQIEQLRSNRGILHICLTRTPAYFPDCGGDPQALKRTIPAVPGAPTRIGLPGPGGYALSVMHDENRNGRLDTFAGIPREGFGFSRNPKVRFGPPRFSQVRFEVQPGITRQKVRMQYLL